MDPSFIIITEPMFLFSPFSLSPPDASLLLSLFSLGHYRIANHSVQQTYHPYIKTHNHRDPNIKILESPYLWHQQSKPQKKKKKKLDPPISTKTHSSLAKPIATQANPASTSPERVCAVTVPALIATHISSKTSLLQPLTQPTSTSTMATSKII